MTDGDAWTGITQIYWVLKNTSCTPNYNSEGHYTILKLKRLLTVNHFTDLNALLTSMETPHLLMIVCGKKMSVNDELENMFLELFSILKNKKEMKIILTTESDDDTAHFIEERATETLGERFIKTLKQLTWSDLTATSQTAILEKTVIFQGKIVALNHVTSAPSMTDFFPLTALLHEKEIRIGKEPVPSAGSDCSEKYYIDRTFNHNIFIRQDILSAKKEGKFDDLLASTEQEFQQLCQQNPVSNVHWLVKDKSGELIWQQSQGNLKTLRGYIDVQESHSYALSDLEKLLQQVEKQRVMLIADKAGMGKSIVLTQLSKGIMEKFPCHWLARINLNKYTDLLKNQKGRKMDERHVVEFLSKEVLKLESDLENELFKKSFQGTEISKVVVMVDGFDEISPYYKETVFEMLQVLKKTSLKQLWVTTRPHLKEELEDNLQQLSYTLQPFSEFEQIEFLKKFLAETSNIGVTDQHRLEIYAATLIRMLAQSFRDKNKEFAGIPLQINMLAKAFEENFKSFYMSEKPEPELPHKLNLLGLYGWFIARKYDVYDRKGSGKSPTTAHKIDERKHYFQSIQMQHQWLALETLFTADQVTFLQIYNTYRFSDEDLARFGIVQRNSEGKQQFIHSTFADYYVAEYLIKHLNKESKQYTQVQNILLNEVLLRTECQLIRSFLDGLLENNKPSNETLKYYGEKLNEQLKKREEHGTVEGVTTALHTAAEEDNASIIGFLLESLKLSEDLSTVNEMLLPTDRQERTALHMAEENDSVQALKKMFVAKDKYGNTAWHAAAQRGRVMALETLWTWAKKEKLNTNKLLLAQNKKHNTAWQLAAQRGSLKILQKLGDWTKKAQLNRNELKDKLLLAEDQYGYSVWHRAAESGNLELLETYWFLSKEWELKPDDILLAKDKEGYTAWQVSTQRCNFEVLKKLWEWANEEKMGADLLKEKLLLNKDQYGNTAWHRAAETGNLEALEALWSWTKEVKIGPDELKKSLFLAQDKETKTPWHLAAERDHFEVLEKMWVWAKETQCNSNGLMEEILATKDKYGYTVWHRAAHRGKLKTLEMLLCRTKEVDLKPEDVMVSN